MCPTNLRNHGRIKLGLATLLVLASTSITSAQELLELPAPGGQQSPPLNEKVEVLTRGPIHEAFASAIGNDPRRGPVITRQPPEEIQEVPPELQLDDAGQVWIPGYWAWDEERNDFLWVSGLWRIPPEGRHWIPGYWADQDGGWQWVSGFWAPEDLEELSYSPRPPASLEIGPSAPAPSDDHFWIPGVWMQDAVFGVERCQWQPGYWCEYREDRVWIPSHYIDTPSGCIFVPGYWDRLPPERGELYAPIFCPQPIAIYRPTCPIQTGHLLLHLFVSRHHNHYLFGDYYDVGYRNRGCYPIYDYQRAARYYNPLLTYYNIHLAHRGINCQNHLRGWHNYYVSQVHHRPPRIWSTNVDIALGHSKHKRPPQSILAAPRPPVAGPRPHRPHGPTHIAAQAHHKQIQKFARERKRFETSHASFLGQREFTAQGGFKKQPHAKSKQNAVKLKLPKEFRQLTTRPHGAPPLASDFRKRSGNLGNSQPKFKTDTKRKVKIELPTASVKPPGVRKTSPAFIGNAKPTGHPKHPTNAGPQIRKPNDRFVEIQKGLKNRPVPSQPAKKNEAKVKSRTNLNPAQVRVESPQPRAVPKPERPRSAQPPKQRPLPRVTVIPSKPRPATPATKFKLPTQVQRPQTAPKPRGPTKKPAARPAVKPHQAQPTVTRRQRPTPMAKPQRPKPTVKQRQRPTPTAKPQRPKPTVKQRQRPKPTAKPQRARPAVKPQRAKPAPRPQRAKPATRRPPKPAKKAGKPPQKNSSASRTDK